jgi:hypothetical protein
LTGIVGLGAAGCVAVPVGGYPDPAVVLPAPGIVIAPPPVVYGHRHSYGRSYYGHRGYYGGRHHGGRYHGRWR